MFRNQKQWTIKS